MKNVLEFLEMMGTNSAVSGLSDAAYTELVNSMDFGRNVESALFSNDPKALESLIGANSEFVCAICVPNEEHPDFNVAA